MNMKYDQWATWLWAVAAALLAGMLIWSAWNLRQELAWRKRLPRQQAVQQKLGQLEWQKQQLLQRWVGRPQAMAGGTDAAVRARIAAWPEAEVQYGDPVIAADLVQMQAEVQWSAASFDAVLSQLAALQDVPVQITSITLEPQDATAPQGKATVTLIWFVTQ